MLVKFKKNVSKGSRFNQVYIPKDMESLMEVGDEVEVRLVKKSTALHYSRNLKKLSEFKEGLIKGIFSSLNSIGSINYIFIAGSFLTEKVSYNDIDIVLITNKSINNFEEAIYSKLIERFNLKLHLIAIEESRFNNLIKICPLTKSMFSRFICSMEIKIPEEKYVDSRHIKFLLMMPHDLLEIKLGSRSFFDGIRRLITIENFLKNKALGIEGINDELRKSLTERIYNKIRNNEGIEDSSILSLRKIIKSKLSTIEGLLKNGQK